MLDENAINAVIGGVAKAVLGNAVEEVRSGSAVDSEGRDVLRVTIVIKPGSATRISGDKALDALSHIQSELSHAGEERFAIVEYATRKELEQVGGAES